MPTRPRGKLLALLAEAGTAPEPAPPQAELDAPRHHPIAKSRAGKRNVIAYLDQAAFRQLKRIAIDEDATAQDLLVEGINAVSEARVLSRIA